MSAAHDAHADHDAGHNDASHHDHFDNEPVQELAADEPRTPGWVPVLGLALFFIAGTAWLFMSPTDAKDKPEAERAPVAAAPAAPPPVAPNPVPQAAPQGRPVPAAVGSGSLRQLSPEQAAQIQKQIEAMRAQREKQGQPAPAPAPGTK